MIELQERFDRAWAGEPEHPPVHQRLADGHRRLRRRRLTVTAGLLGALVTLGGTGVATGLLADPVDRPPMADGPTPVDPGEPSGAQGIDVAETPAELERIGENHNVAHTRDDRIVVRLGWVVTQKIDEVYVGESDGAVGLEITNTDTGEQEWYYLRWGEWGGLVRSWPKANLGMTFREWLPDTNGVRTRP